MINQLRAGEQLKEAPEKKSHGSTIAVCKGCLIPSDDSIRESAPYVTRNDSASLSNFAIFDEEHILECASEKSDEEIEVYSKFGMILF